MNTNNKKFLAILITLTILIAAVTFSSKSSPSVTVESVQTKPVCSGIPTPQQTEGPYYKADSPQRNNIAQNLPGEKIIITGFVFDKNCDPVPNVWLDFWHTDSKGVYDNFGYNLRGHQYTDASGRYQLETIIPSAYERRPPHIHVKIKAPNGIILTSQMYFPNESLNKTDSIFNPALTMEVTNTSDGKEAKFNFVLP